MKTLFLTRSGQKGRGARRAKASSSPKPKQPVSVPAGSPGGSSTGSPMGSSRGQTSWQRHELELHGSQRSEARPTRSAREVASVSSRLPSGGRVRRGFSSEPASPARPHAGSSPGTLEVIRCRGFGTGAKETRLSDGTVQMRLPLGEWILALKTAQEIDAEKSSR